MIETDIGSQGVEEGEGRPYLVVAVLIVRLVVGLLRPRLVGALLTARRA